MTELLRGSGRRGVVVAFDEQSGLGEIDGSDGAKHAFHCIEIADGSRTIAVGQLVRFQPLARFGHFQAGRVVKV